MPKAKKPPELTFQAHVADFFVKVHKFAVLEQSEVTDTEHFVAEDHLWAFLRATQADQLQKLKDLYGADAREEVFRALRKELSHTPLWMLMRYGLPVRGLEFRLFYPKPRSAESAATKKYDENRITFRPHCYFGESNCEIDFVLFLNGLPIVTVELKHEKNQIVHDAVAQYTKRDHTKKIFQHPFMYVAADTSDVKVATNPAREQNFRWHNTGLTNTPITPGEYPVEFLYRDVLSKEQLLEALSFFLVRVPAREAMEDRPATPAFTMLPRFHQSRTVRNVTNKVIEHFAATDDVGAKYLINHSAGSGKTLTICWLADRLHSLFKEGTDEKLFDHVFILTDRKTLDTNIKDDLENFMHLKNVVGLAKKAEDLPRFLKERKSIIVTTQQKFAWILDELRTKSELKSLRVAFLIDEAHRSQEGQLGAAIRLPFRDRDEPDQEAPEQDLEEQLAKIIKEHDTNQLFVAFTATPAPATVQLFGDPYDMYSEAEAIAEGYIVDVAASIISYRTLYHLHCSVVPKEEEEKLYPKGVVAKALKNAAFQDDELIQYKAEVMLHIFEQDVMQLINGRAKAMIVTSSRVAGLRYFEIVKEKLLARGDQYKALYAFSDFVHPETNKAVSEHAINELKDGELIEERFKGDDYRVMIVANKFQTGFDEPLLAGMFLDKPVVDRNAVQTVSRLNRCHEGKKEVVVVDFTNNATTILKAFGKYRKGTPFPPEEPDPERTTKLYQEIVAAGVFNQQDATNFATLLASGTDAEVQTSVSSLRNRFQNSLTSTDDRKAFVYLLARFVKSVQFFTNFVTYSPVVIEFAMFAEYVGPQLVKQGNVSDLMHLIRHTKVIKAAVEFKGTITGIPTVKIKSSGGKKDPGPPPMKVTVQDMIVEIKKQFAITDEEALYIKKVTEEKEADPVINHTVHVHQDDDLYLEGPYRVQVNNEIQTAYSDHGRYEELADLKYTDTGGIFDIMAMTVIQHHLTTPPAQTLHYSQ